MEAIKQTFSGTADFGNDVTATISRNGDLVYRMYLEHDASFRLAAKGANANFGLVERYGDSLIKECEIEIGGQKIDKHTSMWNRVYSDLTEFNPSGHFGGDDPASGAGDVAAKNGTLYQLMTGNGYGLNSEIQSNANELGAGSVVSGSGGVNGFVYDEDATGASDTVNITVPKIFLPLNFWFNRNPGLALPLIALQYHEVKVKMTFEDISKLGTTGASDFATPIAAVSGDVVSKNFDLWCDYIYLDTDERRRFAQVSHEYLIEQLQYSESTLSTPSPSIDLNFNHPVKELIWTMRNETIFAATGGRCQPIASDKGDVSAGPVSIDTMGGTWQLKLNGHDRFKERDSKYFTRTQVWQHHTGYGSVPTVGHTNGDITVADVKSYSSDAIAVYSFALKPEEHQPSGTCNFSRIDNAQLVGKTLEVDTFDAVDAIGLANHADTVKLTIFAVNYNVLRIMSGMGGLAYSN
tara:strand:+ start:40 stop:1434 length:1395 start_codon:yes stop_codon:yes gene_type:complete